MPQDKNIYRFLKQNNLTQKSEEEFNSEYNNSPEKQEQLHAFFKDNNLTQKDKDSFTQEYFGSIGKGKGATTEQSKGGTPSPIIKQELPIGIINQNKVLPYDKNVDKTTVGTPSPSQPLQPSEESGDWVGSQEVGYENVDPKQFETKLSADQEEEFQRWLSEQNKRGNITDGDYKFYKENGYGYNYDFRAAYKQGLESSINEVDNMQHWGDIGKKPNHPTFSDESKYHKTSGYLGGSWQGEKYTPPSQKLLQPSEESAAKPSVSNNQSEQPKSEDIESLVRKLEGNNNYNSYAGSPNNASVIFEDMTIGEVLDWQRKNKEKAVGAYQFKPDTLKDAINSTEGISLDSKFDSSTQDALSNYLFDRRGRQDYINGKIDSIEYANNLAKEFASLPVVTDMVTGSGKKVKRGETYYKGTNNKSLIDAEEYENIINKIKPVDSQEQIVSDK